MFVVVFSCVAHVPTYTPDDGQCQTPPRAHTTSQVLYAKSAPGTTSGVQLRCVDCDLIDFDATFAARYDTSTFTMYVGCVGCEASAPVTIEALPVTYGAKTLEPFTGTSYYALSHAQKTFNKTCEQFGIRIETFANASTMIWGAVIGKGERFTPLELLSFPIFILKNHGSSWNELAWTLPVIATAWTLVVVSRTRRWSVWTALLPLAGLGFLIAASEMLVHTVYAQVGAAVDASLFVALFVVIGLAQLLPFGVTVLIWHLDGNRSPWWALVQCAFGCGLLFFFGSGFFVGPSCLIVDGLVQLSSLRQHVPLADQDYPK